jgi:hypothetical protein
VTHSVHCHRNIVICKKCKEPVPRAELAEHEASEHDLAPCKGCGVQVEKSCMAKHKVYNTTTQLRRNNRYFYYHKIKFKIPKTIHHARPNFYIYV